MKPKSFIQWILLLPITYYLPTTCHSAEIRVRSEPVHCSQTLVILGDIADIVPTVNEKDDQLRQTVLFTAPARGEKRTIDRIELRDILSRLGYSSLKHQLTGAEKAVVFAEANHHSPIVRASYTYENTENNFVIKPVANVTPPKTRNPLRKESVPPQLVKTLEQQVSEAVAVYLNSRTVSQSETVTNHPWKITVSLSQEQARLLATNGQIEEIIGGTSGGTSPPVGQQRFGIRMQGLDATTQKNVVVTVEAEVELPQEAVVLRRSLPKGYIISESDVMLKRVENLKDDNFFVNIAEVVGQETTNAVRELNVLTPNVIKKPTYVHKGDIVTVRLLNNGISVRTEGIAQSDGTQGDTIPVETINPNAKRSRTAKAETSTFLARVCEPKTVEVFASGVIVE